MNFSVDDADPSFAYSTGWAVQSSTDPDLDEFFQDTYHVATEDSATLTYQFQGWAFVLYGSKGPDHANFQLQFDDTVVNLSAAADKTAFRQELFSHSFSSNGTVAQHFVKLTAVLSGADVQGKWLDVDYILFSSGSGSTSSIATATTTPPWETETSSSNLVPFTVSPSSSSVAAASSTSSSSKLPTILAVVFGVLIAIAIFVLIIWLVLRHVSSRRRARERAFRYGQSSVNPSVNPSSTGGYAVSSASAPSEVAYGHHPTLPASPTTYPGTPNPFTPTSGRESASVEMRSLSMDTYARERDAAGTPTMSASRPLMSTSPIAWARQKAREHKGDGDSLRTDFLQV